MTHPPIRAYRANVANASPEPAPELPELSDAIRKVLRSAPKLALLCVLDEGSKTNRELRERLDGRLRASAIDMHLSELAELGYIEHVGGTARSPRDPTRWALSTEPGWRQLHAAIVAHVPTAIG